MNNEKSQVRAEWGAENYETHLISNGLTIIADEPVELGGKDKGFSPYQLLASSLAACTSITLKMYAQRKNLDLRQITVDVRLFVENQTVQFVREVKVEGTLSEEQEQRLLFVANACPVHKILSGQISISTTLSK